MPEQRDEILKYSLDITEVEAKTQRLSELLAQIKAKRGAGEDTSELEQMYGKELAGLEAIVPAQKRTAGGAEELLRQKEKLANVVQLLGGRFGGLVGQLGGVTELLLAAGPAAAGTAAALAGVTALIAGYQAYRKEIDETIAKEKELRDARLAQSEKALQRVVALEGGFDKVGGATRAEVEEAKRLDLAAREQLGVTISPEVLARAIKEGLGDVGEIATADLLIRQYGATVPQEGGLAALLQGMGPDAYREARRQVEAERYLERGKLTQAAARPEDYSVSPEERAFVALRERGALPKEMAEFSAFMEAFKAGVPLAQQAVERERRRELETGAREAEFFPSTHTWEQPPAEPRLPPEAGDARKIAGQVTIINNDNRTVTNAGSVYNHGKKQHKTWRPRMGASTQDHRAPPG